MKEETLIKKVRIKAQQLISREVVTSKVDDINKNIVMNIQVFFLRHDVHFHENVIYQNFEQKLSERFPYNSYICSLYGICYKNNVTILTKRLFIRLRKRAHFLAAVLFQTLISCDKKVIRELAF